MSNFFLKKQLQSHMKDSKRVKNNLNHVGIECKDCEILVTDHAH